MGLISTREYDELSILRKVRNRFARDIHISFDDHQIKDLSRYLTFKAPDDLGIVEVARRQFTSTLTKHWPQVSKAKLGHELSRERQ